MSVRFLTVFLAISTSAACEEPIDNRPRPTLELAQCTPAWRTLFAAPEESPSSARWLRSNGDRLFFMRTSPRDSGIVSVPAAGGATTSVSQEGQLGFWIEGEDLLFVTSDGLFRSPLGGGPVERLLGGGPHFDRANQSVLPGGWSLGRDSLFWAEQVPPSGGPELTITIWRGLRNGGGETALATLTSSSRIGKILPIGDQLIITANDRVWTVPQAGGTAQRLDWVTGARIRLAGILDDGRVLFIRAETDDERRADHPRFVIGRARIDGTGAETLWTSTWPIDPTDVWSDGGSGWYVSTLETATDLTVHAAMWHVDGAGKGIRLACDPREWSSIESAVVMRDEIYMLVEQYDGGVPGGPPRPPRWQLVAVKAPAGSP